MHKEKTWLYTLLRGIAAVVYRIFFQAKIRGTENYPTDTNCIILGNHISAWDPVTIAYSYKVSEIHFMGKESLFKNRFLRAFFTKVHAFSVNRGESDMAAMRTAMQVIRDGHVLGIFPEGTRQQDNRVQHIETGVAVMALKSNVPLVPVLITGKYRLFGKIRVVVGEPIPLDDLRAAHADTQTLEVLKARIIDSLEALRPLSSF